MKKFYAGMILAGMITAALVATGCTNPTGGTTSYSISLNQTGDYTFPEADVGYETPTVKSVVVVNTGSRATGALTVTKSGTNADSFTVSRTTLPGISPGGSGTFTVAPEADLGSGTYTATIAVKGGNGISASFGVSFTVGASSSISLSENAWTFPAVMTGYAPPASKTITVYNTGELATGPLTIEKFDAYDSFAVSPTSLLSIAAGGSATFTVAPVQWLGEGDYTATITVSGENGISASFDVSFKVSDAPVFGISLSETGTYTFPGNDSAPSPIAITVTNTGNQATGTLTIGTSGANPGDFAVSKTNINNIATGGNDSFTVVPYTGLGAGTYTATITVSGGNSISASFNVSFTVPAPPAYSIGLSPSGTYTFDEASPGYGPQSERTVTVYNMGTQPTGALTIAKGGTNPGDFTVSTNSLNSIAVGGNDIFTVVPIQGLAEGTHTATITVSGGNNIIATLNVRFTVATAPSYDISLSETGTYDFDDAAPGYGTQNPLTVTVTNTGTGATGPLTIMIPSASFTASKSSLPSIAAGGNDTFTVVPAPGLGVGIYTALVMVYDDSIGANFDVRFRVTSTPLSSNANLGSLSVSPGDLNPAFSPNTTEYTVLVSNSVTSFDVAATVADTGKAALAQSPQNPVPLSGASTIITLTVTAENGTTKTYTVTVNKTTAPNAIEFTINGGITDEVIDLTKSTENDLSREAGDTLRLTAPEGYSYDWLVDLGYNGYYNFDSISEREIVLDPNWYGYELGTHTVLLMYMKDGIPYGCEVLFRVVR
jgi:uncharacterized membrane protein